MVRLRIVVCMLGMLAAGLTMSFVTAAAQVPDPAGIGFDGTAQIGNEKRSVRFRFFCSSNRGSRGFLSIELEVPRYEQLLSTFDFGAFEGSAARPPAMTRLQAIAADAKTEDSFSATGTILASGIALASSAAFLFDVNPARRDSPPSRKLAAVLRPLESGPGTVIWRQASPKPDGSPINATLELTRPEVDQMKVTLRQCFPGR